MFVIPTTIFLNLETEWLGKTKFYKLYILLGLYHLFFMNFSTYTHMTTLHKCINTEIFKTYNTLLNKNFHHLIVSILEFKVFNDFVLVRCAKSVFFSKGCGDPDHIVTLKRHEINNYIFHIEFDNFESKNKPIFVILTTN